MRIDPAEIGLDKRAGGKESVFAEERLQPRIAPPRIL